MNKALLIVICFLSGACAATMPPPAPKIAFSTIPPATEGGPDKTGLIEGRVSGARPGQKIVLYAKSGVWWIQPFADQPFTELKADQTWDSTTHFGTQYAALLVDPDHQPPPTMDSLPAVGGKIAAVEIAEGTRTGPEIFKTLQFSGYEWKIRTTPSERGATKNEFDAANAWTDEEGFLHLRIKKQDEKFTCAEISLTRSLGYGSYNFVVRDVSRLEPAAVLSLFTWDDLEANQNHREMNIEITRWGERDNQNLQYVIQPYYVPANVARFEAPAGTLTHSFRWEAGRAAFSTVRGQSSGKQPARVADHVFTSGVPTPEGESVHLSFYIFGYGNIPLQKETEIVIEKFEYLP